MSNKHNLVLYVDKDLVENTRNLGFNLSKPFEYFQIVDLRRSKRTAYEKVWFIKKLLKAVKKEPIAISREDLRGYLKSLESKSASYYKNALMALKVFFRDFLELPELVSSFKFLHQIFRQKQILNKEQLKQFYDAIETPKERVLFLLYAATGLRREEILSLKPENIDFQKRMITPNNHDGETKKSWVSFYNEEAEQAMHEYLATKKPSRSQRLFPMQREENTKISSGQPLHRFLTRETGKDLRENQDQNSSVAFVYSYVQILTVIEFSAIQRALQEKKEKDAVLTESELAVKFLLAVSQTSYPKLDFATYLTPEPWTNG